MTSQNDLIDYLTERTGTDPYKLKRLSKPELEQLVDAFKEDQETFKEMYKTMDDLYETIVDKEEALKPENYLSSRELSDRQLNEQRSFHHPIGKTLQTKMENCLLLLRNLKIRKEKLFILQNHFLRAIR